MAKITRCGYPEILYGCHTDRVIITVNFRTHIMIDDHGDTPRMVELARPAIEAYPLPSINVLALDLGSRRAAFDRQLCRRRS